MKIGIISDIEGNDTKLRQVLNELTDCSLLINLGDSVGDKGDSNKVIEILRDKKVRSVLGNHDLELILKKSVAAEQYMAQMLHDSPGYYHPKVDLTDKNISLLKKLKLGIKVLYKGQTYGFYHSLYGKYKGEVYFEYLDKDNALKLVNMSKSDVTFIGHKHIPSIFFLDDGSIKSIRVKKSISFPIESKRKYIINVFYYYFTSIFIECFLEDPIH